MRFAPDPVGPDDGMVEVLALADGPGPTARNEAEAIAESGDAWLLLENGPSSAGEEIPTRTTLPDLEGVFAGDQEDPDASSSRGPDTSASTLAANDGFSTVDPGEAFLDLDIEFEDLETPADREALLSATDVPRARTERYDSIAPEDLGLEWLARATETSSGQEEPTLEDLIDRRRLERMDTLEDISERPTDPGESSAEDGRLRIAEQEYGADSGRESRRS
jgi:hypothetical protein